MKNAFLDRGKVIDFFFHATDDTDFSEVFKLTTDKPMPEELEDELNDAEISQAVAFLKAWQSLSTAVIKEGRRRDHIEEDIISPAEDLRIYRLIADVMSAIHTWVCPARPKRRGIAIMLGGGGELGDILKAMEEMKKEKSAKA